MPETEVVLYMEEDSSVPLLDWLDGLPEKAQNKAIVRVERLAECGFELRRPEADLLRDGVYELRFRDRHTNYRILYFFCGKVAVISHGITKEKSVSDKEIARARERMHKFSENPEKHTYKE